MPSQGLTSTSGSGIDRARAGLQLAREAVVEAAEACRASRRRRSRSPAHSRQTASDSRATSGCSMRLNQPMNRVASRRGMRLVSRKLMSRAAARDRGVRAAREGPMPMASISDPFTGRQPVLALAARGLHTRLQLSRAKHPLAHGTCAHRRSGSRRLVPFYEYGETRFFAADGAPAAVAERRRAGFERLARQLAARAPRTLAATDAARSGISDLQFTARYRVPFQFRRLRAPASAGRRLRSKRRPASASRDLDGNVAFDLTGSYGVNVFGYDFYKRASSGRRARPRARTGARRSIIRS